MLVWILSSSTEFSSKSMSDLTTLLLTFHWASPQRLGLAERCWCEHCPPQQSPPAALTCEPASLTNCSWQTSSWSLQTWQQINVMALRKDESTHTRWKAQFIEELSLFCLNVFLRCWQKVITGKKLALRWLTFIRFLSWFIALDVTCPVKCVGYERVKHSKGTNLFYIPFFWLLSFYQSPSKGNKHTATSGWLIIQTNTYNYRVTFFFKCVKLSEWQKQEGRGGGKINESWPVSPVAHSEILLSTAGSGKPIIQLFSHIMTTRVRLIIPCYLIIPESC